MDRRRGLLLAAGFAAGTVNAVAGGGSLITFPTLVAIGLPPVAANVTNSVAVCPGLPGAASSAAGPTCAGAAPAAYGCALLPTAVARYGGRAARCCWPRRPRAFELVVPFLVLGAAAVLAFQERLRRLVGHPRDLCPRAGRRWRCTRWSPSARSTAATSARRSGVMLVAALGLVLDETLARINALKNAVSAVVGLATVVAFAVFGPVNWAAVAVLAPATVVGGYLGARLARRLPGRRCCARSSSGSARSSAWCC